MSRSDLLLPEDIDEIVTILTANGYERFDVATSRVRVSLVRSGPGWTQEWHHAPREDGPVALAGGGEPSSVSPAARHEDEEGVRLVHSPLPGSFYRAPKPGAPPFVEPGQVVTHETVIGIVETMKVMNSVMAGVGGTLIEVLPRDGEMVSQEHVLARVRVQA